MFTVCWSMKGGSGTSVVAGSLAVLLARSRSDPRVLLVDFGGDGPGVVGAGEPSGEGITDWFASSAPPNAIEGLALPVAAGLGLVPKGYGILPAPDEDRWGVLGDYLRIRRAPSVIDAGPLRPPPASLTDPGQSLLVIRPCYLALRRAATMVAKPDRVVLVDEPGRALRRRDVESVLACPVDAHLHVDPVIARAVDAGLLAGRLPSILATGLRQVA